VLAASAGCVDAVGFLQFGEVFVSFMSGNSTEFGVSLARGEYRDAASNALPIVMFVAGSCLGGLAAHFAGRRAFRVVMLLEVVLLTLAVLLPGQPQQVSVAFVLVVLAMGAQNAALNRTAAAGVGVTYVTGTLAKLGRELAARLLGQQKRARQLSFHAWLWLSFTAGGLTGGFSYAHFSFAALALPIAALLGLLLWSVIAPQHIESEQTGQAP